MKAAVLEGPGSVSLRDAPMPEPGPGEVRVRLEGCGVCASSLPVWEGRSWFEYPRPPGAPGHEAWGRVDALGEGAAGVSAGDRVALLSQRGHAEYDVAPVEATTRLPGSFDTRPFPGEPLACAVNIFRRAGIEPDQDVAVVGVGFLGALLTRLASRRGARVLALSRRPFALEVARSQGAARTLSLAEPEEAVERVLEATGGEGCDRVIEATGKQEPLTLAARLTAVRGRLVIAGYHQDGERTVDMQLWNWRGLDVINAHERDPAVYIDGMRRAIRLVDEGTLDPFPLFTHTVPLERLDEAMGLVRERPDGFLKVLVTSS